MKKLIKFSDTHYIVVNDSEIKEENFFLHGNSIYKCHEINLKGIRALKDGKEHYFKTGVKKITHSTEPIGTLLNTNSHKQMHVIEREIKLIPLSEVEEAVYGYSVEKLNTYQDIINKITDEEIKKYLSNRRDGFTEGFKAHQKLVKDKLFTIEDMKKAIEISSGERLIDKEIQINSIIQSLLPKTEWDVEFDEQGKIKLV